MLFLLLISLKNLKFRFFASFLSFLLLMIGTSVAVWIAHINEQSEARMLAEAKGLHLVVGAKGSPLQLVLSAIFHIDAPTGNISLKEIDSLRQSPMIETSIPISLGDNYNGFRIVGTDENFWKYYKLNLQEGKFFADEMEVVIGNSVAENLKLKIGDTFTGLHGLEAAEEGHEHPFKVVGVLKKANMVADQLILTALASYWHVHSHDEDLSKREITALLVRTKGPMAALTLPNIINKQTNFMAAIPAAELQRLTGFLSGGAEFMQYFAWALMVLAGLSILFSFLSNLDERKFDIALMRTSGGSALQMLLIVLFEAIILSVIGWFFGILAGHGLIYLTNLYIVKQFHYSFDLWQFGRIEVVSAIALFFIASVSAFIPAFLSFKTAIAPTISRMN